MYQLIFSNQNNLLPSINQGRVQSIYPIRSSGSDKIICIRNGQDLIGYKYVESTKAWQQNWSERVFNIRNEYSAALYPWLVADTLVPDAGIIVLKHPDGIRFYQIDPTKPRLNLLKEDGHFHDVYSYTLLFGNFYPNKEYLGVMTRDSRKTVKFYGATSDSFLPDTKYPLFPFDNKLSLTSAWHANDTDFFVTKLRHNDFQAIGLRTAEGLEFYQFNADYLLEHIISTQQITKSHGDRIFFADLTHQRYQDILHLNDSGLFVYNYDHNREDYKFLHHNTEFSQSRGWLSNYGSSIRLFDINSDNRDDLVFTGPQGITALSFDSAANIWKTLISSEKLPGLQRYATVIGSLPAMPPKILQPSILTQDTEGKVQWAKIVQAPLEAKTTMAPTSTAHKTPSTPIRQSKDGLVPDQIVRTNLPEKPVLHWAEQWSDSFLKEAVDIASGQVRLNIPLIDVSSLTGWALQLTLSYDSQARTSDLLGVGWSLPLAQDYIFVDYQGSIFPEDARYYLMVQGRPQLLKLMSNERGVKRFQLADDPQSEVTIEYHLSEQYWRIEGAAEQAIYGRANNSVAKDALRWSLGWSNWRGPGRDKPQQQPLVTAWFLNKRLDKNNQQALYYNYEIDSANVEGGKAYSSALRLKTISDNQEMQITLDYAPKAKSEYTPPNPIDDKGNIAFPIPFAQAHFLQGYSITTSAYSQELRFEYQVNNGDRLLTAIMQQGDPILQFSYQLLLEKQVLTRCQLLPRGSTVNFNFDSITAPAPIFARDNILSYPTRETPKIAYGPDYSIMAYRNSAAGKVTLRIMNREMTRTVIDSVDILHSSIKAYAVQAYSDSFVVFIETDQKKGLYIFDRNDKQVWSTKPTIQSFSTKALVRFSETVIAAADQKSIKLFERNDNQSGWSEKSLSIPRAMEFLALHQRLVFGYDDNQLWLWHHDSQSGWQRKAVGSSIVGLASMNRKTSGSFDLTSEIRQQISSALEQSGLQIMNNFVLLSALQENGGQLTSHIHLFLLDAQYNLIKTQEFKIDRENINNIIRESKSEDGKTIYHMGYIKEGGIFKVRVENVSGKTFDDIRNKNLRQDAKDAQIKHVNQDQEFKKSAKGYFFLDWSLYPIQNSPYGAICGNDILLRISGTGWEKESLPHAGQTILLGKNFILEASNDNKSLWKLYKQDNDKNKIGGPVKELQLDSPDQLINRYPAYIAYHSQPNLVKVLTFDDEKTLGELYTFNNEQLLPESDMRNLLTVVGSSPCKVRPISTLVKSKPQLFVSKMTLTDGNMERLTGYQHSYDNDQLELTSSEKVTMIPGADKSLYGWYESIRSYHARNGDVTKTEHWFNANGREVLMTPKEQSDKQDMNDSSESNKRLLLDRGGKWLISDISPYEQADEMIAYYGFESYEKNHWHLNKAEIIRGKFAFTGESYLELSGSTATNPSFLEGVLQPRDQDTTYLAACWIRSSTLLTLHKPTQYLKAIISTADGAEIVGLLAQTKQQIGDWFYLELPIDFQVVKQIYRDYVGYNNSTSPDNARFKITLRVEAPYGQTVDLDHVRFSPLTHDFQATIYHPITGRSTALIQANGLVIRNVYNRQQQEIASIDEEGRLTHFTSSSKTGKLVPSPQGSTINAKPNILIFEPESGFYETFDSYAFRDRWQVENQHAWNSAPSQLWHKQSGRHQIKPSEHLLNGTSAAIRCYFALQRSQSSLSFNWQGIGTLQFQRQSDDLTRLVLPNGHTISPLPSAGELIVMLEETFVWLWLDGVLLLDQELPTSQINPWSSFTLHVQDRVLLEDMLVMNRPQIKVEYYNAFGEKTQVIQLEDTRTSLVSETLYDELGRAAITTKTTRIPRTTGQPLLAYHKDFVTNKHYSNPKSVWHTDKIQGEIDRLNTADQGVPYTRTKYAPNPLNEATALGLPGSEFSITGRYATNIGQSSNIAFLDNLFPISHGYSQKVDHTPNGSRHVSIFDKHGNQVARYVRVPSYNHLLSTYEYDAENRLRKILPPLYHEKVDTAMKTTVWQSGEDHLSIKEKQWQQALATFFIYDEYGHLTRKITPDSGTTEYLHNTAGQVRFMVSVDSSNQSQRIIYFNYDTNGQLSSTGYFDKPIPITNLRRYLERQDLPNAREYQQFDYADDHLNPSLRGRVKYCITHNEGEPVIDKLQFNAQQQIVTKSTITLSGEADVDQLTELNKQYANSKINTLSYPVKVDGKPLSVVHSYNRLGQLVALGTKDQPNYYASFSYHATGQLASEKYESRTQDGYIRRYRYNSPGFLDQISDPFLTEEMTYTEKGYGQAGYGDGLIMQTAFHASWPINADGRWFQLEERDLAGNYSAICVKALKRAGYLNAHNKPVKLYIRDIETALPLLCGGNTANNIAKLVAEKQAPSYYGHRYAYGNHQELVKAKYFTEDTRAFVDPLQSHSFAKQITNITNRQSQDIWQLLVNAGYIITDQQRSDSSTTIGKRGKSFVRSAELHNDLSALNSDYTLYANPIERFIIAAISKQQRISITDFETVFLHWEGIHPASSVLIQNLQKAKAKQIGQMLFDKGYLPTGSLDKNFTTILRQYTAFIPQIVQVLSQHFAYGLGEAAFDVESYDIDSNGNHHLFYTGFNRYELDYRNATNQIKSVKLGKSIELEEEQVFAMLHDNQGNVIQALHKGIESIKYHPVSQRSTHIQLTDGRTLRFYYDAQGERILKRVFDGEGKLSCETHYLRDEKGRVLVDRQTKYLPEATQEIVTAYLYGPRGLLGFFRNNKFYSVTTDHAGSVRLVVNEGKVVAAYDYLPYGQLMRSYGNDPQAHIMYRYTGQEWDEETGLYNYHARLYDPSIGRFYQPDPKAQYFSPYKYAGNSPISTIDPDGELAFLITCLVLAAVGAYLGGAAANNRWNPLEWDPSDPGTWFGVGGGLIAGGLLPIGFGASVAAIGGLATVTLGAGGAYLTAAAANQNWNLFEWQWSRPHTWSGLFQGFGTGSGIAGGVGLAHNFANTGKALTSLSKALGVSRDLTRVMFLTVSYTAAGGMTYGAGVISNNGNFAFWQWDWESPGTWSSLVVGFDTGMGWPQNFIEVGRGLSKLGKIKTYKLLGNPLKVNKLKTILKNPKHPLYKVTSSMVMAYFMGGAANGEFDITRWSLSSFSTYEGVLNGIFFGKDTSNMLKYARSSKIKKPSTSLVPTFKNKVKYWAKEFSHMLYSIQYFRTRIESKHLIEQMFSSDKVRNARLQQLKDGKAPGSLIRNVEKFIKGGLERWQKGETKAPEELEHLISQEAKQKVRSSRETQKLIEWRTEEGQSSRKQEEIFPDRDAEFLNCNRMARRRKRSNQAGSDSFVLNSIEESFDSKFNVEIKVNVNINGEGVVEKTLPEVYKYIQETHSDIMMPDKRHFVTEHQKLIASGYVLVGYHGTNEIAALSIMLNGFKPSTDFEPSKSHWKGVYAANNLKLASEGYASSVDYQFTGNDRILYEHARVLAVYAKREDIKDIGVTSDYINSLFDNDKPGFELNKKESNTIISGKETGFDLNELVIKKNIDLKSTVLPIITKDDFEAVKSFFKLQEFAQEIITDVENLPFLDDITSAEDPKLAGLSQDSKKTIQEILQLKVLLGVNTDISKIKTDTLIEIRNILIQENKQAVVSDFDLENVIDYFHSQNNIFTAVEDFKAIKDIMKLKSPSDNALTNARELLKLPNLSESGFKGVLNYFLSQPDLIGSIEAYKAIRAFADNGDSPAIDNMKHLLSAENEVDFEKISQSMTEVFKLKQNISIDKLTAINNFYGKEDFVKESAVKDMAKILAVENLTRDSFKAVIGYFRDNKNSVLSAIEDFKAIQDMMKVKNLADNAFTNARDLLKLPNLSESGFKGVRNYFLAEPVLVNSLEIFKSIRAIPDNKDSTAIENLKNLLSSNDFTHDNFNKIVESVFLELKKANNFEIPLEHGLLKSDLKDDQDRGPMISYFCSARSRRSIEDAIHFQDARDNSDHIDPITTSSASTSYLEFWPVTIAKKATKAISSFLSTGWLDRTDEIKSLAQTSPSVEQQQQYKSSESATIIEMGDQWLNKTDMIGLLTLGILMARKWTGYVPKVSPVLSNDYETNIKLHIQSATLVDEFQNAVLNHAQRCGISSYISDIFDDSELYRNTIRIVRKKLSVGELETVPELLYQNLVQANTKKIASKSTQAQANKLLTGLGNDIPNLQQQFLEYEQEWLPYRKQAVEKMASQSCDTIKLGNVGILNEETSLAHQPSSTMYIDEQ